MSWRESYESKKCTAQKAVRLIQSGDHVVLGHCIAEPPVLLDAMVANADAYRNVTISHMVSQGKGEYTHPEYRENFHWDGWFAGNSTRKCLEEGNGDFTPVFFSEIPKYIKQGLFPINVFMVMVSPPDKQGRCSMGVSSDYGIQAVKSAKVVIAEVNDQMPYTYGDTMLDIEDIDALVEVSHPLAEIAPPKIGETEIRIGKYCAELIEDGSTLQLGIGAIPDAVLQQLKDKKHLGIHSEMISDGVVDLVEAGVIDGSQKSIGMGKIVVTFLMGSKRLYDFVDRNPTIEMRTVDYVNHPSVVAQSSKLVSINSCMQVDFMGQVVADTIGTKQFSGVGGQVDFVRGAAMALDEQAKAIIAMPSVTIKKDGSKISKIVPFIDHGASVTTSRHDVDYIVTEYGVARMRGKNLRDRAKALIAIAHPEFREELTQEYEKRFGAGRQE